MDFEITITIDCYERQIVIVITNYNNPILALSIIHIVKPSRMAAVYCI